MQFLQCLTYCENLMVRKRVTFYWSLQKRSFGKLCNLFTHGTSKSSLRTCSNVTVHSRLNWNFGNVGFCMEGGKPEYPEKNPGSKAENQQQIQPTFDVESGNRTWATLVRGKCSHYCTGHSPLVISLGSRFH